MDQNIVVNHKLIRTLAEYFMDYINVAHESELVHDIIPATQRYHLIDLYVKGLLDAEDLLPYVRNAMQIRLSELDLRNISNLSESEIRQMRNPLETILNISDHQLIGLINKSRPLFAQIAERYETLRGWK